MKILKQEFNKGYVFLKSESMDDLWCLSQVIDDGDLVASKTVRKIKIGDGSEQRKTDVVKRPALIKISVEKVEFAKASNNLRVSGKIVDGPDDVPRGSYHTLTIEEDASLSIEKEKFLNYQINKLKEATSSQSSKVLICTLDRETAAFAILKNYGFEYLSEIEGHIQKKGSPEVVKESTFYSDITKILQEYVSRYGIEHIIIASPAFFKDDLLKEIKKKTDLASRITLATCYSSGKSAIAEVLKRDEVKTVLKQDRTYVETSLVEELFMEIGKNGPAAYGFQQVSAAASIGAVRTLLVTDSLIQESRENNTFNLLDRVMRSVEKSSGDVRIISSENEAGKKLDGLGGIGAILRYRLEY
ncbi:MAG TPA: mRNA surveillance protein pelota [Candidatus Nanoarchaeia archaeon]|nr:mRNA surveillance protein pelota [Candidatus Nanoarchaeia archaeon]